MLAPKEDHVVKGVTGLIYYIDGQRLTAFEAVQYLYQKCNFSRREAMEYLRSLR